jgi:hypothetical protein
LFNSFCDTKNVYPDTCGGLFFNDYYFGNAICFVGAFLMNLSLILFERIESVIKLSKKQYNYLILNSLVYAFAIFAYSAFDRVLVGLVYSILTMIVVDTILYLKRKPFNQSPVTFYLALCYTIGTIASLLVRFL